MKKIISVLLILAVCACCMCACGKAEEKAGASSGEETVSLIDLSDDKLGGLAGKWNDETGEYTLEFDGTSIKISQGEAIINRAEVKAVKYADLDTEDIFIVERESNGFFEPFTEFRLTPSGKLSTVMASPDGNSVEYTFSKVQA